MQKSRIDAFVVAPVESSPVMLLEKSDVYNLQVEDCPEYFASGVLVHNCAFPEYAYSDQVDACSGCFAKLSRRGGQPDLSEVQTHDSQPDMSHYGLMLQRSLRREGGLYR